MSASVRIEDEAFADQRYERLAVLAGLADADHARGKMAKIWRQCTIEKRYVLDELDIQVVFGKDGASHLISARLAEQTDDGYRIKGTAGRIEWLDDFRAQAENGGKARAATAERGPDGRMLPKPSSPAGQPDRQIYPAESSETSQLDQRHPAASSAHAHAHAHAVVILGGESLEKSVSVSQLNREFEQLWAWSISPRWYPSYEQLGPFSPAEIRAAHLALQRACKNGSKPNPGLFLRKLEEGRRAPPVKSEAQQVAERERAAAPPKRQRSTHKQPEGKPFATAGPPPDIVRELVAKLSAQ